MEEKEKYTERWNEIQRKREGSTERQKQSERQRQIVLGKDKEENERE